MTFTEYLAIEFLGCGTSDLATLESWFESYEVEWEDIDWSDLIELRISRTGISYMFNGVVLEVFNTAIEQVVVELELEEYRDAIEEGTDIFTNYLDSHLTLFDVDCYCKEDIVTILTGYKNGLDEQEEI